MINPLSLKATAVLGAGSLVVIMALFSWAMWLKADLADEKVKTVRTEGERDRARDQASLLGTSLGRCTAQTDEFRKAGDNAVALSTKLVELAKAQAAAGAPAIASLERKLAEKPPAGAGCEQAWAFIEAERKARGAP